MYYIPQLCQLLPVLNKLLQPLWDDRSQQSDESPAILAMCAEVFVCPPQTSFPSNLGNVYGRRYAGRGAPLVPPRSAPAPSSEHRVATPSPAWQRRSPHNQATNLLIIHRIPGDGARGSSLDVGERERRSMCHVCVCPAIRTGGAAACGMGLDGAKEEGKPCGGDRGAAVSGGVCHAGPAGGSTGTWRRPSRAAVWRGVPIAGVRELMLAVEASSRTWAARGPTGTSLRPVTCHERPSWCVN
jgi:hypothetical protein